MLLIYDLVQYMRLPVAKFKISDMLSSKASGAFAAFADYFSKANSPNNLEDQTSIETICVQSLLYPLISDHVTAK